MLSSRYIDLLLNQLFIIDLPTPELLFIMFYIFTFALIVISIKKISKTLYIKKLFGDKYDEYFKSIEFLLPSTIYASTSSVYILLYLYNNDVANEQSLSYLKPLFIYSIAYTIYDLYLVIKHFTNKIDDYSYILHHVAMFMIISTRFISKDMISVHMVADSLTMEISTIFLNTSIFLYKIGLSDKFIFSLNSWMVVITFGTIRIIRFPYILYKYYDITNEFPFAGLIFVLLNSVWFTKIVQYHWNYVVKGHSKK